MKIWAIAVLRNSDRRGMMWRLYLNDAVKTLIGGLDREDITGKLWVVQRGRIRIHQPLAAAD